MFTEVLNFLAFNLIIIYTSLTVLSLGLAIYFFKKQTSPNKTIYAIYTITLCIFLQQIFTILNSILATGDDYRWAIALLYFGIFYITNIVTIFLVARNHKTLRLSSANR